MYKYVFYITRSGRRPVKDFIDEQEEKARGKIFRSISRLEEKGYLLLRPEVAKLRDKIYELRIQFSPDNFRILYYFTTGRYVVLLHAVKKKTSKVQPGDIETVSARMKDFEERMEKGEIVL